MARVLCCELAMLASSLVLVELDFRRQEIVLFRFSLSFAQAGLVIHFIFRSKIDCLDIFPSNHRNTTQATVTLGTRLRQSRERCWYGEAPFHSSIEKLDSQEGYFRRPGRVGGDVGKECLISLAVSFLICSRTVIIL